MKYYHSDCQLPFSWVETASTFFRRYPNTFSKHVLSEDVISRTVDGCTLRTVRVLSKTNRMPRWGERYFGAHKHLLVVEESVVNTKTKLVELIAEFTRTLTTYTRNIGYLDERVMTIEERCDYLPTVAGDAKSPVSLVRQAWIRAHMRGFVYVLETFGFNRFAKSGKNATKGFVQVMERLYRPPGHQSIAIQFGAKDTLSTAATEQAKQSIQNIKTKITETI